MEERIVGAAFIDGQKKKINIYQEFESKEISIEDAIKNPEVLTVSARGALLQYLFIADKFEIIHNICERTSKLQLRDKDTDLLLISLLNLNKYSQINDILSKSNYQYLQNSETVQLIKIILEILNPILTVISNAKVNLFEYDCDNNSFLEAAEKHFVNQDFRLASLFYKILINNKRYQDPRLYAYYAQSIHRGSYIYEIPKISCIAELLCALETINYAIELEPRNCEWYIIKHSILSRLLMFNIYKRPDSIRLTTEKIKLLSTNEEFITKVLSINELILKKYDEYLYLDDIFLQLVNNSDNKNNGNEQYNCYSEECEYSPI